jgi:chaperonin GroES
MKPLFDLVIIQREKANDFSAGGIIIPDSAKKEQTKGIVVAVGIGHEDDFITLEPGDIVLFEEHSAGTFDYLGNDFVICKQEAVIAILSYVNPETAGN